jgi:OmpA-OmpF porin, OOP family
MNSPVRNRWLALASAAVLTAGCAGCGGLTKVAVSSKNACSWISGTASAAPDTATATSSTVVLIDISASYWPSRGTARNLPTAPGPTALNTLVKGFGLGGTRLVSVGTFDGSATTVSWLLNETALPTATGTSQDVLAEQQSARDCLSGIISKAVAASPQVPGTDVMGALGAAGAELGSTPPARAHVLLITDGLSNTGCLNLNRVLRQGQSTATVEHACAGENGLSRLHGADVQLAGISFWAGQPMSSSEQSWLENYWRGLCAALGVSSGRGCIAPQGRSAKRVSAVSRPHDPAITFPKVTGRRVVVPAPLLFAFNSAILTQTARSYLDILIQQIRSSGRSITEVIGHTDRVGSASYNLRLSQRRAQAVQAYLASRGFRGIQAIGVGFSQPACPDEYTSAGRPNEKCMAKDRRVEIILGGRHG